MTTQLLKPKKNRAHPNGANGRANKGSLSELVINGQAHIPSWVTDHDSFRRWACSDRFPERGQFFYLNGKFWMDLSMEKLIHNQIKGAISAVLTIVVFAEELGNFFADRMMLTHEVAGLSCEPDGMFVANDTLEKGFVTFQEGDDSLEVLGTPDMTLEIISKSSIEKDTVILKDLYAKAGIAEYWLVDSIVESPELTILRLASGKYVPVRKQDGWSKSKVFGRSFRLTCKKDPKGISQFNLETR